MNGIDGLWFAVGISEGKKEPVLRPFSAATGRAIEGCC